MIDKLLSHEEYRRSFMAIYRGLKQQQVSEQELDFFTSAFYYMVWGPDFSLFSVPFHRWLILNMNQGRDDSDLLSSLTEKLQSSTEHYIRLRDVSETDAPTAIIDEIWSQKYDPLLNEIEAVTVEEVQTALWTALIDGEISPEERAQLLAIEDAYNDQHTSNGHP